MNLTISRAALLAPLISCAGIASNRHIPILGCVKLKAEKTSLTLTATDCDIVISHKIELPEPSEGAICVEAAQFADIVRRLPDDAEITISAKDAGRCVIASGKSRYTVGMLPVEDFPSLEEMKAQAVVTVEVAALRRAIEKVAHYAPKDDIARRYLEGVHICSVGDMLRAEATDDHRVGRSEIPLAAKMPDIIVPNAAVSLLLKLLDAEGDALVEVSATRLSATVNGSRLVSKLIDGTFPDIDRVIPGRDGAGVRINRVNLMKTVERLASVVRQDRPGGKGIDWIVEGGLLKMSRQIDASDGAEEIEVDGDAEQSFGINPRYLIESLSVMSGDVIVRYSGTSVVRFEDCGSPEDIHVIMRMR